MKVVILAGGLGTRLAEETDALPKPLVEIGSHPIIWHVMKIYASAGFDDFIICCGYKGQLLKNYFANYFTQNYDVRVDLKNNLVEFLGSPSERWTVTLVDTGLETMTGGRLQRISQHICNETFCLTYGDGLAHIDVSDVVRFHRRHGRMATITAVPSPGRFGILELAHERVMQFREKPSNEMGWINGGFFVCEPSVLRYIDRGDETVWERRPLERLAADGELMAYHHTGFWRPMDTLRDKRELEQLWKTGKAPWKIW